MESVKFGNEASRTIDILDSWEEIVLEGGLKTTTGEVKNHQRES